MSESGPNAGDGRWTVVCRWAGGLGLCVLLLLNQYASLPRALGFDEVDYVQAARQGVLDNYLERSSINVVQFIALARAKANQDAGAIETLARSLPPEHSSLEYLRHQHPPLMAYVLAPWTTGSPGEETRLRWVNAVVSLILVTAAWIRWGRRFGMLGLVIFFCSPVTVYTLVDSINPHTLFTVVTLLYLAVLQSAVERPDKRKDVAIALCAALLLLSMVTAVVVLGLTVLVLIVSAAPWGSRERTKAFVLNGLRLGAYTLVFFWILWPGSLKMGEPLNNYARYVFKIFFLGTDIYGRVTAAKNWQLLAVANPLLFTFLGCGLVAFALRFKTSSVWTRIVFVIGLGYCAIISPFIVNTTYVVPGLAILTVGAITTLNSQPWGTRWPSIGCALAMLLLPWTLSQLAPGRIRERIVRERHEFDRVVDTLRQVDRPDRLILAESGHILKYYDPALHIESAGILSTTDGGLYVRRNYAYVEVTDLAAAGAYSAVVLQRRHRLQLAASPTTAASFISTATRDLIQRAYPHDNVIDGFWIFRK